MAGAAQPMDVVEPRGARRNELDLSREPSNIVASGLKRSRAAFMSEPARSGSSASAGGSSRGDDAYGETSSQGGDSSNV